MFGTINSILKNNVAVASITINCISSVSIIAINKLLFSVFPFSNFVTIIHFVVTWLALYIASKNNKFTIKHLPIKSVAPLALLFCGYVALNNLSLALNSPGFVQTMKILITPCVAIIEFVYRNKTLKSKYYACIGVICVGVFISTVHGGVELNIAGTAVGFLSMIVSALYQIFIDKKQKDLNCSSAQLLYYQSPMAAVFLTVLLPYIDNVSLLYSAKWSVQTGVYFFLSCFLAFFVNISMFLAIGKASPITYNVFSQIKTVSNYIVAILIFHEPTTFANMLGMTLTVGGIISWSAFKMKDKAAQPDGRIPSLKTKVTVAVGSILFLVGLFLTISQSTTNADAINFTPSIVVAGGAGYIGSHVTRSLLQSPRYTQYRIIVIDNLSTGHRESLPVDSSRFKFVKGDISNEEDLEKLFTIESPNTVGVIHLCAASLVGESVVNPLKYYDNNVVATTTLVKSMIKYNVNNLIFSSTAAIFGVPEKLPILENAPKNPTNPYGETKLAIEKMLHWTAQAHPQFRWIALRYFNAAGADHNGDIGEAHSPESHLIPNILKGAMDSSAEVKIFGNDYDTKDGTNVRDYIHVTDLSDAHLRAMSYLITGGNSDVFNLGNGAGYSNLEVVNTCRKITGIDIPINESPRRPGDPASLVADSTKAFQVLGWKPVLGIEQIVKDAWNWHQNHPELYK